MARPRISAGKRPRRAKRATRRRSPTPHPRAIEATLADVAHEIRTPLTGILALGELLATSELGARERGWATAIKSTAEHPQAVIGDALRLRAALENLIDNAVKFTEHGSVRLDVTCERAARGKERLIFTVTDSGIGLTAAEIKRLFRPFAQASAQIAQRYGGAGLGLAAVMRIAKAMGGNVTVTSAPGSG